VCKECRRYLLCPWKPICIVRSHPCCLGTQELSGVLDKGGYAQYPALAVCKQRLLDLGLSSDVVDAVLPFIKVRTPGLHLHNLRRSVIILLLTRNLPVSCLSPTAS